MTGDCLCFTHVVGVEGERIGRPFRTTPERLAGTSNGVLRQAVEELADGVVVLLLELETRPDDAFLEGERLVRHEVRSNLLDLLLLLTGVLQVVLEEIGLRQIGVDGLRRLHEEAVEVLSCPLQVCQYRSSFVAS